MAGYSFSPSLACGIWLPTESNKAIMSVQPPCLLLCLSPASHVASHGSAVVTKSSNTKPIVR